MSKNNDAKYLWALGNPWVLEDQVGKHQKVHGDLGDPFLQEDLWHLEDPAHQDLNGQQRIVKMTSTKE